MVSNGNELNKIKLARNAKISNQLSTQDPTTLMNAACERTCGYSAPQYYKCKNWIVTGSFEGEGHDQRRTHTQKHAISKAEYIQAAK